MDKTDPHVFLSDLAAVLGEPANTIAQMLKRGGFSLPDADCRQGTGNWTRFTMADVATLALIRSLTGLGMQVRHASEATQYTIEVGGVELTDLDRFIERWRDARLWISRTEKTWSFAVFEDQEEVGGPAAYITVNVAQVVENAVQRARQLAQRHERRIA